MEKKDTKTMLLTDSGSQLSKLAKLWPTEEEMEKMEEELSEKPHTPVRVITDVSELRSDESHCRESIQSA